MKCDHALENLATGGPLARWQAEVRRKDPQGEGDVNARFTRFARPADLLRGRPRSPGVDVLSRGGDRHRLARQAGGLIGRPALLRGRIEGISP